MIPPSFGVCEIRRACLLSDSAYNPDSPQVRERLFGVGCDKVLPFDIEGTVGFVAWNRILREVAVAFAGTSGLGDVLNDANTFAFKTEQGYVHDGFRRALAPTVDYILQTIHDVAPDDNWSLLVTGHSLGGAMAAILAGKLQIRLDVPIRLVTFGQPRTGWADWTRAMDQGVPGYVRVVHDMDCVPHVPVSPYHHTGEVLHLAKDGAIIPAVGRGWRTFVHWFNRILGRPKAGITDHFMSNYVSAVNGLNPLWTIKP